MPEKPVVIISGGSRGLGATLVRRLLDQGATVATFSRKPTAFVKNLLDDKRLAPRFHFQSLDATDTAGVRQYVSAVHDIHGRIDALINNAAVAWEGTLATFPDARISSLIDINLTSVLHLTKACSRLMLLRAQGKIINISSIIGRRGYAGLSAYSASKAGLIGMTTSLARELGPKNITVNAIAPGYLTTEMSGTLSGRQKAQIIRRTPLGRLGTTEDVAGVVEFLLSPAADFITGQVITVDGGITC